ncbi:transposase [Sinorhizobium fredii]|uniref:transposase n=1 Tax=Rhizobium fredii TaxID=380 RepID=UPI0009B61A2F
MHGPASALTAVAAVKVILLANPDGLREVIRAVMQEVLEAEMDEVLGATRLAATRAIRPRDGVSPIHVCWCQMVSTNVVRARTSCCCRYLLCNDRLCVGEFQKTLDSILDTNTGLLVS